MVIVFRKLNEREHALEVGGGGACPHRVTCETRSLLRHDLLHYAVEAEAGIEDGVWGNLARGRRVEELGAMADGAAAALLAIERLVGALDGAAKGQEAAAVVAAVRRYDETSGVATPAWLTEEMVFRVQERMRRFLGQWKATPFGSAMELTWPPRSA